MASANNGKKIQIIEAAKRVVAEKGFNKLTYRLVAKEANISLGTLYYYYNTDLYIMQALFSFILLSCCFLE